MNADPLSREAIAAVDPGGMLDDVLAQPLQVADALWRARSADIARRDLPGGLIVSGMGGSAIGGDLAVAALGDRATRPIRTIRGYGLEPWTPPDTLVLCASHSGETEETLACFESAGAVGAARVVMTTGGPLAGSAREEGVPVIGVPSGMAPRAAVLYMTIGALECAAACGAAPELRSEIEAAGVLLERLVEEWGPDSGPDSEAKAIAHRLTGTLPVLHGAGPTAAAARRWTTQLNENADMAAFWSELPEADHNEVCGWELGRRLAPLSGVFLEDPDHHPRVRRRVDLTIEEIERAGAPTVRFGSRGDTRLERVVSLVLLGDLVSVYLAALAGVDPTPTPALDRVKDGLIQP
ncbi:MAG TPA: bifunctional phosphoglucose/phosphomannose isomerase [Thermoleophilaceae bacterium]|nr:bifunctional phosphoglucose/phosphomannose isomerase [Thermoleophilaceae bacterium]